MMSLVEKKYNALYDPSQLRNMLNETCHFGQLILRGYAQEHTPERKAMDGGWCVHLSPQQ